MYIYILALLLKHKPSYLKNKSWRSRNLQVG